MKIILLILNQKKIHEKLKQILFKNFQEKKHIPQYLKKKKPGKCPTRGLFGNGKWERAAGVPTIFKKKRN